MPICYMNAEIVIYFCTPINLKKLVPEPYICLLAVSLWVLLTQLKKTTLEKDTPLEKVKQ